MMLKLLRIMALCLVGLAVYAANLSSVCASYWMYYEPELPDELK